MTAKLCSMMGWMGKLINSVFEDVAPTDYPA
jgi:hypothetical protein